MISHPLEKLALLLALVSLPTALSAQTYQDQIGYTALLAELGSPPGGGATLTYLKKEDTAWRYRKGTSEASIPTDAWRLAGFTEDASWSAGQTSVGYSDGDDNTVLSDMRQIGLQPGYSSVFLRRPFTAVAGQIPHRLVLRVYIDDGAIIWINGTEVARVNMAAGNHAFNSIAATAVQEASWHEFRLEGAQSYLVPGINMLAAHGFNAPATSSDFSFDCELFMPPVTQVESVDDRFDNVDKYLPLASPNASPTAGYQFTQVGGAYNGTTVEVNSIPGGGVTFGQSPHAANVASRLLSNSNSIAPDIDRVRAFESNNWLGSTFLNSGSSSQPTRFEYSIAQNHSWIATDSAAQRDSYNRALRRYDYSIAQDDYLAIVGVNNWLDLGSAAPPVPPLFGTAYHAVAVGLTNGLHSQGGTVAFYDGPGRLKPDIVAPDYATSYSTAQTTAAAALLYEVANFAPALSAAMNVEAMKAILLAGATKEEFTGWSRTSAQPLDAVYGAGELNIRHSYHILKGGKQTEGTAATVDENGWDFGNITTGSTRSYRFDVADNSILKQFSALVTWHRQFSASPWTNNFGNQPALPNIDMRLYRAPGGVPQTLVDSSLSTVDNLEHIYRLELPAGEYVLQLTSDTTVDYGIAWRAATTIGAPTFTVTTSGNDIEIALSDLVDSIVYTVERSTDLQAWTGIGTVTGGDLTPTILDIGAADEPRYFYHVAWDPEP